jgi:alkylation response protein AidB-like acyl-CoA dehydrogenase
MAAGMAAGACEAAFKYTKERIQFKKPVAGFQLIQAKLVRCVALASQSVLLCMQITRMYEDSIKANNPIPIGRIAMAKAECTRNCREVCQLARESMGGNGIQLENQAMKVLCDIEAIHTYEGSHEINTLVAGREMTGLAAFK